MSVNQLADGTYAKTYSDAEISIIRSLTEEIKTRFAADQQLWVDVTGLQNRIEKIEGNGNNVTNIEKELTLALGRIQENRDEITRLDALIGIDAYSKKEIDQYISLWKIEQIPHRIATPTNDMFDKIDIDELQSGYVGFKHADIHEPHDNHMPENTMRRYTISAYVETPRDVTFNIHYADRLVFILNGETMATYTDTGGNFGGVAKVLPLNFKEGWNKIQILVANETQRGGVVIQSNLFEKADYLTNLDDLSGMITGDRIQSGTLDESHFSPNMDLVVRTLWATADTVPGVIVGNPNGCGILQIGDKTITKCVDEPFVFDDGIRVNGYIYVSQLLIDVDFILQGDGILIDKIKDMATGFTRAYVIHNDLKVFNGGGLTIVGDGRKGYTFTNAMKLDVHPDGGLEISGDPVNGYVLTNAMKLSVEGTGGLLVTGNPRTGYFVKNIMNLSASRGLKVEGEPWTAAGYKIKNTMEMTGDGILVTPFITDGDAVWKYHLENDTNIEVGFGLDVSKLGAGHFKIWNTLEVTGDGIRVTSTGSKQNGFSKHHLINDTAITANCLQGNGSAQRGGGLAVFKTGAGQFTIGNDMSLTANYDGPVSITGSACVGYVINAKWPNIRADGEGIIVQQYPGGEYYIKNTGVLGITTGEGLSMGGSSQRPHITNTGVIGITGGEGISIEGSMQRPSIKNTMNVVAGSSNVQVQKNGSTFVIAVDEPIIPPPIDPPPIDPGPPSGGGGNQGPGGGGMTYLGHGSGEANSGGTSFKITTKSSSSQEIGVASGNLTWNDSTSFTFSLKCGAYSTSGISGGRLIIKVLNGQGGALLTQKQITIPSTAYLTPSGQNRTSDHSMTINKSELSGGGNNFYVGVFVSTSVINNKDFAFAITNPGNWG